MMPTNDPEMAVRDFFSAFNDGNVEAVLALYEPKAALVAQPAQIAEGTIALRAALDWFFSMKPTLTMGKNRLVIAGDLALSVAKWTLTGTGSEGKAVHMEGTTSDVLRPQADGRWLFVIDNPWGVDILS
jgi:uncharacterized protein (TIGR02246 family)